MELLDKLAAAIFDTSHVPSTRYMWYAPIGHIKSDCGKMYVLRDNDEYTLATPEERAIMQALADKLRHGNH